MGLKWHLLHSKRHDIDFRAGLVLTLLALNPALLFAEPYAGPIFDAHAHIQSNDSKKHGSHRRRSQQNQNEKNLIDELQKAGFIGAYLFGPPPLTEAEAVRNPKFVVRFGLVPRSKSQKDLDTTSPSYLNLLQGIKSGAFHGIGELSLRHQAIRRSGIPGASIAADGPEPMEVFQAAAINNVPVNVHIDHEYSAELERALAANPETKVIWAHAGDAEPELVSNLMQKYSNLFADISCRNPYLRKKNLDALSLTEADGKFKPSWKALFEKFPDRFLLGLDIWVPDRIDYLPQLVVYYRNILGQLPKAVAEKIAYKNALGLIKSDDKSSVTD